MAIRLKAMGRANYINGFKITIHPHLLTIPLRWKRPQTVFVNSMSDLFHKDIPTNFILKTFDIMQQAYWHRFQILTKRSQRLRKLNSELRWASNIWMGVTVESKNYTFRIDDLRATGAHIKFLSLEPLLGPIPNLNLNDINWVIVGGESGPYARPMEEAWAVNIRDQCRSAGVPFFFKQWGGINRKRAGRILEDRLWEEMPETSEPERLLV
jgi:protein gp37